MHWKTTNKPFVLSEIHWVKSMYLREHCMGLKPNGQSIISPSLDCILGGLLSGQLLPSNGLQQKFILILVCWMKARQSHPTGRQ
jgi:hypothetical protein